MPMFVFHVLLNMTCRKLYKFYLIMFGVKADKPQESDKKLISTNVNRKKRGRKRSKTEVILLRRKMLDMVIDEFRACEIQRRLGLTSDEWDVHIKEVNKVLENIVREGGMRRVGKRIAQGEMMLNKAIMEDDLSLANRWWESLTKYEGDQGVTEREAEKLKVEGPSVYAAIALLLDSTSKKKKTEAKVIKGTPEKEEK